MSTDPNNLPKQEPYLTKLFDEIERTENFSHVGEIYTLAFFIELIYTNEEKFQDVDILDIVKTDYFKEKFFSPFKKIDLGENFAKREYILKEAFELYKLEYYAGCLTLLYGQLEGILTDYLVFSGLLEKNKNYYNYLGDAIPKTDIDKKKKITGIFDKILIAKNMNIYFGKLDAYKIDSEYKINNDRNDVLHGNILDRFTKERCFILIIWLTSIFNFLLAD